MDPPPTLIVTHPLARATIESCKAVARVCRVQVTAQLAAESASGPGIHTRGDVDSEVARLGMRQQEHRRALAGGVGPAVIDDRAASGLQAAQGHGQAGSRKRPGSWRRLGVVRYRSPSASTWAASLSSAIAHPAAPGESPGIPV